VNNGLGTEGAESMAPVFQSNMTLAAVHLGQNSMGSKGVKVLTEVLEQGPYEFSLGRFIVRRWLDDPNRERLEDACEPMTPEQARLYYELDLDLPWAED
jgi:hypothetical protein